MTDAREYGRALFLLAEESGRTDKILSDLNTALSAFSGNGEYAKLLDTPAISKEERLALIDEAFSCLDEYVKSTLKILCEQRSVHLFIKVADAFKSEYDLSRNIERVEAISAIAMTEGQLDAMKSKLEAMTNKTIIIKNTTDPSILGGVKLRYMGRQLDGSVRSRLDSLGKTISGIVM